MTSTRSPRTTSGPADASDARRPPRDKPRKRSLSPDSLDERPTRRRRSSSSSSSGDDNHRYARHHDRRDKALSRKRSISRDRRGPASGRRDGHDARHRSRSRSRSREVTRRRRGSYSRSESRSPPPPPRRRRSYSRSRSRTPPPRRKHRDGDDRHVKRRRSYSHSPAPPIRSKKPLPSQLDSFRGDANGEGVPPEKEKEKVNWKTTGLLAAETNTVQIGTKPNEKIVLKYNEPPDSRKPPASARWRLYIFKGAETLGDVKLSTQSCWLIGREAAVADMLIEHPSSSKQHAVIQFRYVVKEEKDKEMGIDDFLAEFGEGTAAGGPVKEKGKVRPYLLDLDSINGTFLNGERIGERRYVELREKDIIKFGLSEREYVVLKE